MMRFPFVLPLFLLGASPLLFAQPAPPRPARPAETPPVFTVPTTIVAPTPLTGRVTLFNGRDLSGLHLFLGDKPGEPKADPASAWSIADGVLALHSKASGYVVTDKTYENYLLHVEWRWPKEAVANSNSGVLVHLNGPDIIWPSCFECQLKTGNAGQVVGMGLDIPAAPLQSNRKRAPKLAASSEKPLGEWNTYEIFARGDTIEVFINGTRQNFVEKLPVHSGGIALQLEGYPIEFRTVWVEPAPPRAATQP
jgi:hypothetical protein